MSDFFRHTRNLQPYYLCIGSAHSRVWWRLNPKPSIFPSKWRVKLPLNFLSAIAIDLTVVTPIRTSLRARLLLGQTLQRPLGNSRWTEQFGQRD